MRMQEKVHVTAGNLNFYFRNSTQVAKNTELKKNLRRK